MECVDIETLLSIIFKCIAIVLSMLSLILGFMALRTWRKQIKYKVVYDNALKFEASMTLFSVHTSSESDMKGNKYLKDFNDNMLSSYWLLLQRDFMAEEARSLYNAFHRCMENCRETNETIVPKSLHEELVTSLNIFSLKLRKAF